MNEDLAKRLRDAIAACDEIQHFSSGRTRVWFLDDRGLQLAIWKLIEIVGEALRQAELLEPNLADAIPELRDVINTRNRITHGYGSVNFNLLWDIATQDIILLREQLEALLGEPPAPDQPSPASAPK